MPQTSRTFANCLDVSLKIEGILQIPVRGSMGQYKLTLSVHFNFGIHRLHYHCHQSGGREVPAPSKPHRHRYSASWWISKGVPYVSSPAIGFTGALPPRIWFQDRLPRTQPTRMSTMVIPVQYGCTRGCYATQLSSRWPTLTQDTGNHGQISASPVGGRSQLSATATAGHATPGREPK